MFEFETARNYATFQSETGRNYQRKKPAMRRAFLSLPQTLNDTDLDRLKKAGAAAIGKTLGELDLARLEVEVKAVWRNNVYAQAPQPGVRIETGDVLVLLGSEQDCAAAEMKLIQG
jgi:K+/H+ antiporter YhaU regulatory subunit KhtT